MAMIPVTFACPLCKSEVTVHTSIETIHVGQGWRKADEVSLSVNFASAGVSHFCPDPTQDKMSGDD